MRPSRPAPAVQRPLLMAAGRVRLFVALDLPVAARTEVAGWRDAALGSDQLRPVADEALHVTLAFLGWRDPGDVEPAGAVVGDAARGASPCRLVPGGLRGLPRRRPRLFALELEDPGGRAGELQGAVAVALAGAGLYEPEDRPFWPHVTVARVPRGGRVRAPAEVPPPPGPFTAGEVALYRSHTGPAGARYEALQRVALGATKL